MDAEIPAPSWPAAVVGDLRARYFDQASAQLGVTVTSDFIYGDLQNTLRQQLFNGIRRGGVANAMDLGGLPLHLDIPATPTRQDLLAVLGLPANTPAPPSEQDLQDMLRLEAPLAVRGRAPQPGFFPLGKFSAVPLLTEAARAAWFESPGNDATKRVMVVPQCHVLRLAVARQGNRWQVTAVATKRGTMPVPNNGRVVLALGTIESSRLALWSFL